MQKRMFSVLPGRFGLREGGRGLTFSLELQRDVISYPISFSLFSVSGSILSLNSDTLQSLEQLLNKDCQGADWAELAKRLGLSSLMETYKGTPSPSRGLLLSYEVSAFPLLASMVTPVPRMCL